ncbi:MAG: outer membrane lipoprotein-sorting protein [Kiritimatiellaeota bacterium]|nr:outer membrane lipoprotein-sorting protein [Kiritimatiellota bacterium]
MPAGTAAPCAAIRLWIEAQVRVLLQAETCDVRGQRLRALRVKSFKKIQDLWMIQDLEVETYPARHRTLLRVQEVRRSGRLIQGREAPAAAPVEPLPALPPEAPVGR